MGSSGGRQEHFAQGAGHLDLFHGTNDPDAIKQIGLYASYSDSAHLTNQPRTAHDFGKHIVHFRVPPHAVEDHGGVHGSPGERWYGMPAREEEDFGGDTYETGGHLDASYIHCINGPCTRH